MVDAMQLTTGWIGTTISSISLQKAQSTLARLVGDLRSIKVFRASGTAATLFVVATAYWFFAAMVWPALVSRLIGDVHQLGALRIAFEFLSVVGAFVVANELVFPLFANNIRAKKILSAGAWVALVAATTLFWGDKNISMLIDAATERLSLDFATLVSFIGSGCLLMGANIILPVLGGAFLFRAVQHLVGATSTGSRTPTIAR
jgi:hypothetical protein